MNDTAGAPLNPPSGGSSIARPPFEKGTTNASDSLAVTAKRFMDMIEPLGTALIEQMRAEMAANKKGKGQ